MGQNENMVSNPWKKAFTLVETLCVVGIVAALAGLLFPVFAAARLRARSVSCLGNVRAVGLATLIYQGDHDDRFPWATDDFSRTFPWLHGADADLVKTLPLYSDVLRPYAKSREVFRSPVDSGTTLMENGGFPYLRQPSLYAATGSSYDYMVSAGLKMSGSTPGLSRLPLLKSAAGHWLCGCAEMPKGQGSPQADPEMARTFRYSIAFGDGHAETMSYTRWYGLGAPENAP